MWQPSWVWTLPSWPPCLSESIRGTSNQPPITHFIGGPESLKILGVRGRLAVWDKTQTKVETDVRTKSGKPHEGRPLLGPAIKMKEQATLTDTARKLIFLQDMTGVELALCVWTSKSIHNKSINEQKLDFCLHCSTPKLLGYGRKLLSVSVAMRH